MLTTSEGTRLKAAPDPQRRRGRECSFAEIWEASPVAGDSMEAEPFCTYEPAQDTDVDLV